MNAELHSLNREAAQYGWDLSTQHQSRVEFTLESMVQLAQRKSAWLQDTCDEGALYRQHGWPYDRAYYLLCRGPRNTPEELSEMAQLFSFIQRIYTESEVCIPANCGHRQDSNDVTILWSNTFVRYPGLSTGHLDLSFVAPVSQELTLSIPTKLPNELQCFSGEPDLERLMLSEGMERVCAGRFPDESVLRWAWESWRMAVGPPMRQPYGRLIELMNSGCMRGANHRDVGECWREELEIPELRLLVDRLWHEVKPFYQKLHTVVRHFVRAKYPRETSSIDSDGLIPAHLLGGMWSHSWIGYAHDIIPHRVDIDRAFGEANWTSLDLVQRAEDLYASLGLPRLTDEFWKHSVIGKTADGGKCHGTAANMFADGSADFRMIVCPRSEAPAQDFYVTVHEMGHIVYYMEASKQPTIFSDGTTAAFQEAFGDAMYFGAVTPQHLVRLGLLDSKHMAPEKMAFRTNSTLNSFDYAFLLRMALGKIPTIPFEYLMDQYRWDIFDGSVEYGQDANSYFWFLLERQQGIRPPSSVRARLPLFDAASVYHLSDNTPFVRYFLASFLSYQIYEGLCRNALFGTVNNPANEIPLPLHRCDLYGSKKAGKLLRKSLALGGSVHWTEVLEELTGDVEISAQSLLKYYQPLDEFLDRFIEHHRLIVGWEH
ncbi:angiotensin-converting enzyme-like [Anopheles maculipalpis]|uniref:angiotensin-converting enzyme-like n=1 Tax=Anopheles maculipalpis TaxID=1496333 RepID=UPI00215936BC|nr:angiotensin-converting enzyme-like [Anopheles maculipalpis]